MEIITIITNSICNNYTWVQTRINIPIYLCTNSNKDLYGFNTMENIREPNDSFSFDSLKLSKPVVSTGGSYFIRFSTNGVPLYIQPPKCKTKQGFLKTGKRYYTDLLFTHENDEFVRWMENLEATCHNHLFENREKWFEGDMELHDIENYFTSPMKIYKTGKYYIVRVNIQTNLGVPALTIYDENNDEVGMDTIDDKTDIITILELKGIKCTSTSFQIDIETKQVLTVKPVALFTKCVIKAPSTGIEPLSSPNIVKDDTINTDIKVPNIEALTHDTNSDNHHVDMLTDFEVPVISDSNDDLVKENVEINMNIEPDKTRSNESIVTGLSSNDGDGDGNGDDGDGNGIVINTEPLHDNNELEEFTIDLDTLPHEDNITIKKSNDVYYKMYREASRKAKVARDLALSSWLEAKRIKNTYMLEDISDSDESDLEQEMDFESN